MGRARRQNSSKTVRKMAENIGILLINWNLIEKFEICRKIVEKGAESDRKVENVEFAWEILYTR